MQALSPRTPSSSAVSLSSLASQHQAHVGAYNELISTPGQLRAPWKRFWDSLGTLTIDEFNLRWEQAQRLVHENSLAHVAYGTGTDRRRPWQLDPLPVVVSAADWQLVSRGLEQRARLLNLILKDIYGPQQLLQQSLIPPELVLGHPGFQRSFCFDDAVDRDRLQIYAADLARSPDGTWWLLADRTEAPSGMGYALENRLVTSRMLPGAFHHCQVERLAPAFIALRELCQGLAQHHRENPRVVILSQGAQHRNYFEEAYLARYLGYLLAEGQDLTVRDSQVLLKTLGGLMPVDVIVRRPNSDDCDPLEIPTSSSLGVVGLLQAVRNANIAVTNPLGSGLVESPAFLPFMARLAEHLLGEALAIPNVATWWCGDSQALQYVLANRDQLWIKPAFRRRGNFVNEVQLNALSRDDFDTTIRSCPQRYVAQERIVQSSTISLGRQGLESAQFVVRGYAVRGNDSFHVMQGGLIRLPHSSTVDEAKGRSEGSKDLWVLADRPVRQVTLLHQFSQSTELRRGGAELPSRVADNLFWVGRQLERAEAAARLLRTVSLRLTSELDPDNIVELPALLRVLAQSGQIEPGYVVEGMREQIVKRISQDLPEAVTDPSHPGNLRSMLNDLIRTASLVRDRLSLDTWRIMNRIDQTLTPVAPGESALTSLLTMLNSLVIDLSAFSGLASESMTRTQGWRFLDLGRRLERAWQTVQLLLHSLGNAHQLHPPLLEAVLEIVDSLMTYRSRYLSNIQLVSVLDLILTDETNPRSVVYQLSLLCDHAAALPRLDSQPSYSSEQQLAMSILHAVRVANVHQLSELHELGESSHLGRLLTTLDQQLPKLSDAITHRYLVHAVPSVQISQIPSAWIDQE
ncbi:MAG: circularly permuted type 2 ATP-grasp protein [Pirellulaceae bacterium]|nr:circularly permuted type 2 ATP-grasp protein [Planctomycetales bacterium]